MTLRCKSTIGYYDNHAAAYAELTAGMDVAKETRCFANLLFPDALVLDVGCGGGRDLIGLTASGLQVEGVDASSELAAIAQTVSDRPVTVADIRNLPFEAESFDGLWAMASLLHIEEQDLNHVLVGLFDILRPGGLFFSSVRRGHGLVCDQKGRWFTLHAERDWGRHLEASGFEVIDMVLAGRALGTSDELQETGWISCLSRRPL